MEESIGVILRDPSKYRDEVLAVTAFNQPSRKTVTSRASKYSSFFKRRSGSSDSTRSIDSVAEREVCQQLAAEGDLEGLKSALERPGVTLKDSDANGASLLHRAAIGNRVEIMQYLIESGIQLDSQDNEGNTSLHVAVQEGSINAIHLLLNSCASDVVPTRRKKPQFTLLSN